MNFKRRLVIPKPQVLDLQRPLVGHVRPNFELAICGFRVLGLGCTALELVAMVLGVAFFGSCFLVVVRLGV